MNRKSRSFFVNALTFARVPLIFAWLVLAVVHEQSASASSSSGQVWLAAGACLMMLLSGLTDLWDGQLARRWEVVSKLGKMADPLMDKIFYLVAFPALVWQIMHQGDGVHALVMLFFTIVYMLRDTWVSFLRMISAGCGADVAAMWLGKVRTALSFPGAGWVYMYCAFHRMAPESWQTPWLTSCYLVEAMLLVLTVWSMISYTNLYGPYFKKALEQG